MHSLDALAKQKQMAARAAMRFIESGMTIGLGSGTTVAFVIAELGARVAHGLDIVAVPSSSTTERLAETTGIPLRDLSQVDRIDVTIDGADEIDAQFRMIKGGGGALLREKILAYAADQVIIVVDSSKQVEVLGQFPLPVEVTPFAVPMIVRALDDLRPLVRLGTDGTPFTTDNGNRIIDCRCDRIDDPSALDRRLRSLPGIVSTGLFIDTVDFLVVGHDDGKEIIAAQTKRPRKRRLAD
ncbi:MAG: ribose-5-phosphate isomerase RpiA [Chloroflexota bacterium]|nr:MAG: ribose-5-phosphate isomerase RpiA [Chloroflexota bacterium]